MTKSELLAIAQAWKTKTEAIDRRLSPKAGSIEFAQALIDAIEESGQFGDDGRGDV